VRINSLPVFPLYSTVADFLSFLYGTAHDLFMSQYTSESRLFRFISERMSQVASSGILKDKDAVMAKLRLDLLHIYPSYPLD